MNNHPHQKQIDQMLADGCISREMHAKLTEIRETEDRRQAYRLVCQYDKRSFRNALVGFYVDDDGFATDSQGTRLTNEDGSYAEIVPGELLCKNPNRLIPYRAPQESGQV